jgi:hypothetical protein
MKNDYLENRYNFFPLNVSCDISNPALLQALRQLHFELDKEYVLVITREDLEMIPKVLNGIINIKVEVDDSLPSYGFMVRDDVSKTIVYSPGA